MRGLYPLLVLGALLTVGCGATPPTAPDATPADPQLTVPPGAVTAQVVGAGGHDATGTLVLSVENGHATLKFGSDFSVAAVPSPVVYVNTANNPNTGEPLRVAALDRNSGEQTYGFVVPDGVHYTWVLVWCDAYNVPVAQAEIPPTP